MDVMRYNQENSSAQHSADATALAVATDCVLRGGTAQPAAVYDAYRKTPLQRISLDTPLECGSDFVRVTVEKDVNGGLLLNRDARTIHRPAKVRWRTVSSANTIPITIAECEFRQEMLAGTTNIYLYLDQPSPLSGCSGGPGGFGSLTDTGNGTDCRTVSVVNNVAVGGTGASDHVAGCIASHFESILSSGGFVDVLVPIYRTYSRTGSNYNYTIVGYAAFRMRGYEFQGNNDAGTLNGNSQNCPDRGPGNERCLYGDFINFVAPEDATPGTSVAFGAYQVFLYQ
jgi:hypothetical protein